MAYHKPHIKCRQANDDGEFDFWEESVRVSKGVQELGANVPVCLFLGKTGVGKSTCINSLCGIALEAEEDEEEEQFQVYVSSEAKRSGLNYAEIGVDVNRSQTKVPYVYQKKDGAPMYCDFPGFLDTEGRKRQILNDLMLYMLTKRIDVGAIVYVVRADALLSAKGEGIKELFLGKEGLFARMPELFRYSSKIFLFITHPTGRQSIKRFYRQVQEVKRRWESEDLCPEAIEKKNLIPLLEELLKGDEERPRKMFLFNFENLDKQCPVDVITSSLEEALEMGGFVLFDESKDDIRLRLNNLGADDLFNEEITVGQLGINVEEMIKTFEELNAKKKELIEVKRALEDLRGIFQGSVEKKGGVQRAIETIKKMRSRLLLELEGKRKESQEIISWLREKDTSNVVLHRRQTISLQRRFLQDQREMKYEGAPLIRVEVKKAEHVVEERKIEDFASGQFHAFYTLDTSYRNMLAVGVGTTLVGAGGMLGTASIAAVTQLLGSATTFAAEEVAGTFLLGSTAYAGKRYTQMGSEMLGNVVKGEVQMVSASFYGRSEEVFQTEIQKKRADLERLQGDIERIERKRDEQRLVADCLSSNMKIFEGENPQGEGEVRDSLLSEGKDHVAIFEKLNESIGARIRALREELAFSVAYMKKMGSEIALFVINVHELVFANSVAEKRMNLSRFIEKQLPQCDEILRAFGSEDKGSEEEEKTP